ncbi:hypothetical protein MJO47_03200 [Desulfuromonas sp. KJ2020]|uniref:hypothetical protein n=1 Tax=Desulfuromonas sp. KJ2020 TaxID=2919173 RepID=UPI0020A80DFB|nr:hypothetical protein [Desulfuromonas sp. KJ2020]MCP3176099.1 hypothetical protein [Desulfuromonas sp. KJ2020]
MSKGASQYKGLVEAQQASQNPQHDKFGRLTSLSPDKLEKVHSMAVHGHSPRLIARSVQVDMGECLDITEKHLARIIERYRVAHVPIDQMIDPYVLSRFTEKVRRNVNHISELSALIDLQKERLRQVRLEELEAGKPLQITDKQIALLNRLLRSYSDAACKSGLVDIFASDYRREIEGQDDEHVFSMEMVYKGFVRQLHATDPQNFEQNLLEFLAWSKD